MRSLGFFLVRKARNTALCAATDAQLAEPADTLFRYLVLLGEHRDDSLDILRFVISRAHTHTHKCKSVAHGSALLLTAANNAAFHSCSCRTANCADVAAANAQRQRILHAVRFEAHF